MRYTDQIAHRASAGSFQQRRWLYVLCVLWISASIPLSVVHLIRLWKLPHYQFFPLLIGGCAFLAWRVWPKSFRRDPVMTRIGYPVAVVALGIQVLAAVIYSPWMSIVAMLLSIAAMACIQFDRSDVRALLPIWLLLWLLVPLPFGRDQVLVQQLQSATSQLASALVDLLGIGHLLSGNVIELPGQELFVDEACSGVNTVFALLAVAGLYACAAHRPWAIAIPLMVSAAFWAGLINVVRIVIIVVALDHFALDLTDGLPHTALALMLLPVTLVLLLGTDQLLMIIFGPVHRGGWEAATLPPQARTWNRVWGWSEDPLDVEHSIRRSTATTGSSSNLACAPNWWLYAAIVSLLLCLVQIGFFVPAAATVRVGLAFQQIEENSLPSNANGWNRTAFESRTRKRGNDFGERSLIWKYTTNNQCLATASLDFPFVSWHELTNCYERIGWTVLSREIQRPDDANSLVVAELEKPTGERGILVFSLFDREGNNISSPDSLANQFRARLGMALNDYGIDSETYQFQVFLRVPPHVAEDSKQDVISRFIELRETLTAAQREAV